MKYLIMLIIVFQFSTISKGQNQNENLIILEHLSLNFNHYIPTLLVTNINENRKSNHDTLFVSTQATNFNLLFDFMLRNSTDKVPIETQNYQYGSFRVLLIKNNRKTVEFVIDDNSQSILFFKKVLEFIKLNKLGEEIYSAVSMIIPNSFTSKRSLIY